MLNSIKRDLGIHINVQKQTPATNVGSFADAVKTDFFAPKITETQNGNIAFSTSGTPIVDFFFQAAAMRNWSAKEKRIAFSKAYAEDKLISLRLLFYFRDIREGQGERELFRDIISDLAKYDPATVRKNLPLFSEYGRWDDLFCLLDTTLKKDVVALIADQLEKDWADEFPSLLAKWMKSENTSSSKSRKIAVSLASSLGLSKKEYRLMLVKLRAKINIVETKISKGDYASIDYSNIPSNAAMKYRKAFYTHDADRYDAYLEALSKPAEERAPQFKDVKVNAKTLYPHEIVSKIMNLRPNYQISKVNLASQQVALFEAQWKALPDYFKGNQENILPIADLSGSMSGVPMDVAIALSIYAAERNVGKFKDIWMNFSSSPSYQVLSGDSLYEKVRNLNFHDWGMTTDINKALQLVLDTGLNNNLAQSEMPSKIIILSDMQFDRCVQNAQDGGLLETFKKKFLVAGFDFPQIVFWNLNATDQTAPTFSKQGVALVSGFSPQMFSNIFGDLGSAMDVVLKAIEGVRYEAVQLG